MRPEEAAQVAGRSVVARKLKPLPIEAVVRGYLIGSGWKDYRETGAVCGIRLPAGLRQADRLPEILYTPATKAEVGAHDENISFAQTETLVGAVLAAQVRDTAIRLYREAAAAGDRLEHVAGGRRRGRRLCRARASGPRPRRACPRVRRRAGRLT